MDREGEAGASAFGENPPGNIGCGSRREPDDDVDRSRRIALRRRNLGDGRQCSRAHGQMQRPIQNNAPPSTPPNRKIAAGNS
jgi:hypothetical protein